MRNPIILLASLVCVGMLGCGSDSDEPAAGPQAVSDTSDAGQDSAEEAEVDAAGTDAEENTANVGIPCTSADTCPAGGSGNTVCLTDWPGGYCAVAECEDHGHDCPNDPGLGGTATTGGKCVLAPTALCLALCASDADCREGYECVEKSDAAGHGAAKVCVPKGLTPADDAGMSDGGEMGDGGEMAGDGGMMGGGEGGM